MKGLFVVCLVIAGGVGTAHAADPVRLALVVGQDVGGPGDDRLRYAERDARRMWELLTDIGGVSKERAYLLLNASADQTRNALRELRGRSAELRTLGKDPVIVIYVSSHADKDGLRLGATRLPHRELRELLAAVPARLRLLIVDACASGALVRRKGGKVGTPFSVDLEQSQALRGQVVLASTGPGEPAQEWEALGGSLFSHHLMSGLRGAADLDQDGRITLFEGYSYAYGHTLSTSVGASAGAQHPWREVDLRGAGDFVLTRPVRSSAKLMFPSALEGRFVVTSSMGGELVAEVRKTAGRRMQLALTPGRYLVRKPEGRFVRVGEVQLLPGSAVTLDPGSFERVPYTQVARRGPGPVLPHGLELGYALATGLVDGQGPASGFSLGVRREAGPWEWSAAMVFSAGELRGQELTIDQRELWGHIQLRWRYPVSWLLPYLGAGVAVGWVHQSYERDREREIRAVFGGQVPDADGVATSAYALLGAEVPVTHRLFARLEGLGGISTVEYEQRWRSAPVLGARAALGWRF